MSDDIPPDPAAKALAASVVPALPADPFPELEIAELAKRARTAGGPLITLLNRIGGTLEDRMNLLPAGLRRQVDAVTLVSLERAFAAARLGRHAPDIGPAGAPLMAALAGAAGGAGGLATAVAELPVTVTLILHTIRSVAEAEGFDPDDDHIRAEILRVFASGSPMGGDDGVNTAFIGARLTLSGAALNQMVARFAPKIAAALSQKLAAQAVPVLGAISGAALNTAFLRHYRELARIRFRLLRLAQTHDPERVLRRFAEAANVRPMLRAD